MLDTFARNQSCQRSRHSLWLNVDEYYRMKEAGLFLNEPRIELINGEVVEMSPSGSLHVATVNCLTRLFARRMHEDGIVSVQNPVQLAAHSDLQPDVALSEPHSDDYEGRLPIPENVFLVIEVADTSARSSHRIKAPLYTKAETSERWIVDVPNLMLEVHTAPTNAGYGQVRPYGRDQSVAPLFCRLVSFP